MKIIPNVLSFSRLLAAFFLLFVSPLTAVFFILYLLCGISDVLDGYLARKMDHVTTVGSALDSIADMVFLVVLLYKILPILPVAAWMWCWVGVIVMVRVLALIVAAKKYHTFAYLHTYLNKLTGLLLFAFPAFYVWLGLPIAMAFVCLIATISAIEELFIDLTSDELERNIKCINLDNILSRR